MKNTDWTRENNRKLRKHRRDRRRMGQRKLASEQLELRELLALTTIDLVTDLTIAEGTHRDITLDHISGPTSVLVGLKIKGTSGNFDPGVPLIHVKDNPSQTIPLVSAMANVNGTTDSLVFFQMGTSTLTIEVGGSGGGDFQAEIFLFGDSDGDGAITEAEYMKASAAQMQGAGTGNANTAMYYKSVWGIDFNQSQYDYEYDLDQNGKVEAHELNWVSTNRAATGVHLDLIGDVDPPTITSQLAAGLDTTPVGFPGPGFANDSITNADPATGDVVITGTIADFSNITSATISGTAGTINLLSADAIAQKDISNPRSLTYGLSRADLTTLFGSDVFATDNTFVLMINAVDDLGNTHATPLQFTYTVDITDPAAPSLVDLTTDSGLLSDDNITNATTPSFDVTVEAGTVVELLYREESAGTFTSLGKIYDADQDGKVTFVLPTQLSEDGKYIFKAVSYDIAGNESDESGELMVEIDRTIASPVVTELDNKTTAPLLTDEENAVLTVTNVEAGASVTVNSITIVDGSAEDLDATAGQVQFGMIPLDTIGKNTLQVTSTDIAGNTTSTPLTLTVIRNTKPELDPDSFSGLTLGESTPDQVYNGSAVTGFNIGFLPGTTDAGENYSYQVTTTLLGAGMSSLGMDFDTTGLIISINNTSGAIVITDPNKVLDYENGVRFVQLSVIVTDDKFDGLNGPGLSDTHVFTIAVEDLNETPAFDEDPYTFSILESQTSGTVGSVSATDPDETGPNSELSYSFTSTVDSRFAIDNDGKITIVGSPTFDFETEKSIVLEVTVTDAGDPAKNDVVMVTINVTDVNEAPTMDAPTTYSFTIEELAPGSTTIAGTTELGTILASDPDAADDDPTATNPDFASLVYTLTGTGSENFEIGSDGTIKVASGAVLDFEGVKEFNLEVHVTDMNGAGLQSAGSSNVKITLSNVNEAPIIDVAPTTGTVDENDEAGAVTLDVEFDIHDPDNVGKMSGDADYQTLMYELTDDAGGLFEIDSDGNISLAAGKALNFEVMPNQFLLKAIVSDGALMSEEIEILVKVNDIDEPPVVSPTTYTISTVQLSLSDQGTGKAILFDDPEDGTVTFMKTGGDDEFTVDTDGNILFVGTEIPTADADYSITVDLTDGTNPVTQVITIQVRLNQAPVLVPGDDLAIPENSPMGTSAGSVTFTDPDTALMDTVESAVITGISSGLTSDFELVFVGEAGGEYEYDVRVVNPAALNTEANPTITLSITVTDNNGVSDTIDVDISVENVNDLPEFTAPNMNPSVDEYVAAIPDTDGTPADGDEVFDLTSVFSDEDMDSLEFSIVENDLFEIVGNKVVIKNAALLDADAGSGSFVITVSADDDVNDEFAAIEGMITIDIAQRNELPLPLDDQDMPIVADGSGVVHLGNITLSINDLADVSNGGAVPGLANIYSILNFGPDGPTSDPEGDVLKFIQAMNNNDQFTIAENGDITFTDTAFLDDLEDEETFTLSFSYFDDNANSLSSTDLGATSIEFTITIVENAAPVFSNFSANVVEIAENSDPGSFTSPVLMFDVTDPEGDTIDSVTASAVGIADGIFSVEHVSGSQYRLVVASSANLDYEAILAAFSSDTFTVTLTAVDGNNGSGSTTIDVTVTNVNEAPVATGSNATIIIDESKFDGTDTHYVGDEDFAGNGASSADDGFVLEFAMSELIDNNGNAIFTDVDSSDLTLSIQMGDTTLGESAYSIEIDDNNTPEIDDDKLIAKFYHYQPGLSRGDTIVTVTASDGSLESVGSATITFEYAVKSIVDVQIRAVKELSDFDGAGADVKFGDLPESTANTLVDAEDLDNSFYYEIWVSVNYGADQAAPGRVFFDGPAFMVMNLLYNSDALGLQTDPNNTNNLLAPTILTPTGYLSNAGETSEPGQIVGMFGIYTDIDIDSETGEASSGNGKFAYDNVDAGDYIRFATIPFQLADDVTVSGNLEDLLEVNFGDVSGITGNYGATAMLLDAAGSDQESTPVLPGADLLTGGVVDNSQYNIETPAIEIITDFMTFTVEDQAFTIDAAESIFGTGMTEIEDQIGGATANLSGNLYVQILDAAGPTTRIRIVGANLTFSENPNISPGDPPQGNETGTAPANYGFSAGTSDFAIRDLSLGIDGPVEFEVTGDFFDDNMGTFDSASLGLITTSGLLQRGYIDSGSGEPASTEKDLTGNAVDTKAGAVETSFIKAEDVNNDNDLSNDQISLSFDLARYLVDTASPTLRFFGSGKIIANFNGGVESPALTGTVSANGGQTLDEGSGVFVSVVDQPTELDDSGQIAALPVNETWVSEWDNFWVEIWANTADANGIQSGMADLKYNSQFFTATKIEYAAQFDQAHSGVINDINGTITNLGSGTLSGDLGKDGFVLLGRVKFESLAGDGLSIEEGLQFGPQDLGLEILSGQLQLSDGGLIQAATGANPNVDVWAVPYDLDDDGTISLIDLSQLVRRIGSTSIAANDALTAATDFDNDGRTSIVDLSQLIRNIGISKTNASNIKYPTSFTQLWVGAGLVTNGPDTIESIFTAANNAWAEALGLDKPLDVRLEVTDLGGAQLGEAKLVGLNTEGLPVRGVLTIDDDGAGFGWSTDLENGPGSDQYDLYTVMLHELGHLYGFMPQYSAFGEHVTDFEGSTIFVGDMYSVELDSRGEHLDVDTYASDVMSPYLAPGIRKEISALDTQMILTAYSSADSSTTVANHGAALTEQPASSQPTVEQPVNIVSPVSETSTVDVDVIQSATSFVLGDNVANLADVSGRTGLPVVMPESTRRTLEQSGIAFKTLSNYSAAEFDNVSEVMTEVETYFDDSTLIESTISDIDSDADDSSDGDSIDDLFAEWDEIEMA
ncbi:cadherin domain-containing protein [Blastopirellula marina]|uniref:Fat protein-possibly involved in cell-cell attachment n=1 Tax=Blastopirellula marina DSM 3645 TaxID=314230 RepID=A4A1I4_9BACT|nr:cadherin domain-containing protein [Blastopirellula marina]EAQ77351.1 fat protein-possibly involved in cell-cell attachment [Blastopirellula marina DSM 3645]